MSKLEKLISSLEKKRLTLALAESCTGGYASYLLTKIPGSSKVFKGSLVVYSLDAKTKLLNISPSLLKKTDGVSKEIAASLAQKVRKKLNANIGASIVGFAGPTAKGKVKIGTIFIGIDYKGSLMIEEVIIKGARDLVRRKAGALLINLLYERFIINATS
jgi:PncC family amidohydrolase